MFSYWEKESLLSCDYLIVGSGIVGLSTAISLAEAQPNADIWIIEKDFLPTGASTKNAGFACFGSLTEILSDLETMSDSAVLELIKLRWDGLNLLRSRLGDDAIGYEELGGYELISPQLMNVVDRMESINKLLTDLFPGPVFSRVPDWSSKFSFNKDLTSTVLLNAFEGQIHTGKMMKSLLAMATAKGIRIFTGTTFVQHELSSTGHQAELICNGRKFTIQCRQLGICSNAFTKGINPHLEIEPGRGHVIITEPLKNAPKGTFHYDEGYYYFRNVGDRVLLGGARNKFRSHETTTDLSIHEPIVDHLKDELRTKILSGLDFEIDESWTGIMAFGKNKKPILEIGTDGAAYGVRMGGMGIAIGSKIGLRLADLLLKG